MSELSQLDRIEAKVDKVSEIVHQHVGILAATKWILGGVGATIATVLTVLSWLGYHSK